MDTSYLTQQVTSIIGQLHNLFDEIGVPSRERDSRESELFASLSETLHNHLKQVSGEKLALVEEAQQIITTIKQMEASLEDGRPSTIYAAEHEELKVTYPLLECLHTLREKHKTISKMHQERYEQVRKLIQALESYASHLEPSFLQIKLPQLSSSGSVPPTFNLSPSYISSVDNEFTRVYDEYNKRVATVGQLGEEIVKLWAELGTPQSQTEPTIVQCWRECPEQLGLHKDDVKSMKAKRDKLIEEKAGRERKLKELRSTVESLWDRLGVEESERKAFLSRTRGCGLRIINDLEAELSRLNELKRQNLHLFVEDARTKIQALWDELFFAEEEAVEFTPMFCDVYSDALLSAHESEIQRLETLKEQRAPLLELISRHRFLVKERDDLQASSQDASRLMMRGQKGEKRDPGKLLREEKMRKRIAKELPKIEQDLAKMLEQWEEEYGRQFTVFGERYLEVLESSSSKAAPPRSKTPNPVARPAQPTKPSASSNTQKRPASREEPKREPPTLRSKTPVGTIGRSAGPSAQQPQASQVPRPASPNKSPSRIPARVPLGTSQNTGNSPDRKRQAAEAGQENGGYSSKTLGRKMIAPPPKMRNFEALDVTPSSTRPEDVYRSGSVVRQVQPEDPYSDQPPFKNKPYFPPPDALSNSQRPLPNPRDYQDMPPPPRPPYHAQHSYDSQSSVRHYPQHAPSMYSDTNSSRQISASSSNASSVPSATSNWTNTTSKTALTNASSENWETLDEGDCGDSDTYSYHANADAYHARLRAIRERDNQLQAKLGTVRGKPALGAQGTVQTVMENGQRVTSGSDAGWTDDTDAV